MDITAERLKECRLENKFSQTFLADSLNIARNTLSSYENGRVPSSSTLADMAKVLGVSADYLLGLSDLKRNPSCPLDQELQTVTDICVNSGAHALTASHIRALCSAAEQYASAGYPAGNLPIDLCTGLISGCTMLLRRLSEDPTTASALEAVNALTRLILDASRIPLSVNK